VLNPTFLEEIRFWNRRSSKYFSRKLCMFSCKSG